MAKPNLDGVMPDQIIRIAFDLETMSLEPTAAIVQIGASVFQGNYSHDIDTLFNGYINPQHAEMLGTVDKETMQWWDKQDPGLRRTVFGGTENPYEVLESFTKFVSNLCDGNFKRVKFYCKDISLDWCALRHAYEQTIGKFPFHYRSPQQHRTLQDVAAYVGLEYDSSIYVPAQAHNALFDAIAQGEEAIFIIESLAAYVNPFRRLGE